MEPLRSDGALAQTELTMNKQNPCYINSQQGQL